MESTWRHEQTSSVTAGKCSLVSLNSILMKKVSTINNFRKSLDKLGHIGHHDGQTQSFLPDIKPIHSLFRITAQETQVITIWAKFDICRACSPTVSSSHHCIIFRSRIVSPLPNYSLKQNNVYCSSTTT